MNARLIAAAGLLAGASLAQAQQLSYVAAGINATVWSEGYVEFWGRSNEYAAVYSDADPLLTAVWNRPAAVSEAALSVFTTAQASFSYNLATPVRTSSSTATSATSTYVINPFAVTLSGANTTAHVTDAAPRATVRQGSTSSYFLVARNADTADGPLTADFSFTDASPVSQRVDLAALMRAGADNSGTRPDFDLTGFTTLPARVRSASTYQAVWVGLQAYDFRTRSAPFSAALPDPLALQNYNNGMTVQVLFDGIYTVSVQPEDFATQADYQRASTWVNANLRQFNYEIGMTYNLLLLQALPVPEPAGAALLLAGMALLVPRALCRRHRRRHRVTVP